MKPIVCIGWILYKNVELYELRNELGISSISFRIKQTLKNILNSQCWEFLQMMLKNHGALKDEFGGIDKITKSTLKGVVGLSCRIWN